MRRSEMLEMMINEMKLYTIIKRSDTDIRKIADKVLAVIEKNGMTAPPIKLESGLGYARMWEAEKKD